MDLDLYAGDTRCCVSKVVSLILILVSWFLIFFALSACIITMINAQITLISRRFNFAIL